MNLKLTCHSITQTPAAGQVRFTDLDKDGKPVAGSPILILQTKTAKEAGTFTQGNIYDISIKPAK